MHAIVERAVERGLQRRQLYDVRHLGVDEKSFGEGHDYVSIMTDMDGHRVLEVVPERTIESCDLLWKTLTETQQSEVESVSMDMWQAVMTSAEKNAPQAEVVHDRFHVSKHLNEAVDKVRRQENRRKKRKKELWP
jgi:transposase